MLKCTDAQEIFVGLPPCHAALGTTSAGWILVCALAQETFEILSTSLKPLSIKCGVQHRTHLPMCSEVWT